jgi:hypothetical protein
LILLFPHLSWLPVASLAFFQRKVGGGDFPQISERKKRKKTSSISQLRESWCGASQ